MFKIEQEVLALTKASRIENPEDKKLVREVTKLTLDFMIKHNIDLTPENYQKFFFVIMLLRKQNQVTSEKNIVTTYNRIFNSKFKIKDINSVQLVSNELHNLSEDYEDIFSKLHENVSEHSDCIQESIQAIKDHDEEKLQKMEEKLEAIERENELLKEALKTAEQRLVYIESQFIKVVSESETDKLSGAYRKEVFDKDLRSFMKDDFGLILFDIDDFKEINDKHGHKAGDDVIKNFGSVLNKYVRNGTKVYRIGGDEFAIILPFKDSVAIEKVAKRICEVVDSRIITTENNDGGTEYVTISVSAGASKKTRPDEDPDMVFRRADKALYEAKKFGKNQVVVNIEEWND